MNARPRFAFLLLAALAALVLPRLAAAADYPDRFYKASFLQTEERDHAAAAKLFAQIAEDDDASEQVRKAARTRLAECREEIAAADLASLMPAETLLYVQLANLGPQAKRVLETLGIAGDGKSTGTGERIPIEEGLSIPLDFALSPALVREIGKLGGGAAAMTGIDERGVPRGVAVVHLGDSDLVRGLVETGLQVVTPNESIGGHTTFRIPIEGDELWMVKTERLLIFSNNRDEVAAAAERIEGANKSANLAGSDAFKNGAADRTESLLFVWADSQRAAPLLDHVMQREMQPQELMAVRAALGLHQIECATLAVGATEKGLRGQASIKFKPDHHHFVYSLIRTAPIDEDALAHIPASAGVVAAFGLNPPAGSGATSSAAQGLALMDIGREVFANIRSVSVFASPGEGPLPEIGVVVLARDAEKSKQLWSELMALPAKFGALPPEAVQETEISGHAVTQYAYPEAPPIFVTQPTGDALVIGTAGAVQASLATSDGGESLAGQLGDKSSLVKAGDYTSKAIYIRAADVLRSLANSTSEHESRQMMAVAPVIDQLEAALTVDEDPNELRVRLEIVGVPKVREMLRAAQAVHIDLQAPAVAVDERAAPVAASR